MVASTFLFHKAMAIEHSMHRTFSRQSQLRVVGVDSVAQFRSTPSRKLFFEINNELLDLEGQPIGLPKRPS